MKATINGKRYDSNKCELLAAYNQYNNGNLIASHYLLRASDGTYLIHIDSTGQDCYMRDNLFAANSENITVQDFLECCDLDDAEEKRLVELGLLTIIE